MKKIERLNINGFKCFLQQQVEFKQLTVFAGINSLGKSTIIQSILLSRFVFNKASKFGIKSFAVPLNGHFMLNLGNSSNLINKNAETILLFKFTKRRVSSHRLPLSATFL
jgi:predicted ATP-dependent endonuclease of OLD family